MMQNLALAAFFLFAACSRGGLRVDTVQAPRTPQVCQGMDCVPLPPTTIQPAQCSVRVTNSDWVFPLNAANQLSQPAQMIFDLDSSRSVVSNFQDLATGARPQLVTAPEPLMEMNTRKTIVLAFNQLGQRRVRFTVQESEDPRTMGTCEVTFEIRGQRDAPPPPVIPAGGNPPPGFLPIISFVDLKVNNQNAPIEVGYNDAITLSWVSQNVQNCSLAPVGPVEPAGTRQVNVITQATYTLTCNSPGGPVTDSVTVNLAAAPMTITRNDDGDVMMATCMWASVNGSPSTLMGCNSRVSTPNPVAPQLPLVAGRCNVISLRVVLFPDTPLRTTADPTHVTRWFRFTRHSDTRQIIQVNDNNDGDYDDLDLTLASSAGRSFVIENSGQTCP